MTVTVSVETVLRGYCEYLKRETHCRVSRGSVRLSNGNLIIACGWYTGGTGGTGPHLPRDSVICS